MSSQAQIAEAVVGKPVVRDIGSSEAIEAA
jgi:hypothetical protein